MQQSVLVGLSGGLDSFTAAYLLLIQKRKVFAATIIHTPDDFQPSDELFSCHVNDQKLEQIKKFCEQTQIPLTVLRPKDTYREAVIEPWVANRYMVRSIKPCHDCHHFRLKILFEQMKVLQCTSLATGHYAKIFKRIDQGQSIVQVHSSNDARCDQAHLLLSLEKDILQVLELPLSELQRKEVQKIADNFFLKNISSKVSFGQCLLRQDLALPLLVKEIPPALIKPGEIFHLESKEQKGSHHGLIQFVRGQVYEAARTPKDENLYVDHGRLSDHSLMVLPESAYLDHGVQIKDCVFAQGVDFSQPLKGFLAHDSGDRECLIIPKPYETAVLLLKEGDLKFLLEMPIIVRQKKGKNAKVLLHARISRLLNTFKNQTIHLEVKGTAGLDLKRDENF